MPGAFTAPGAGAALSAATRGHPALRRKAPIHTDNMITTTRIFLEGLRFHARHGVLPQERTVGGSFTLDLSLDVDLDDDALVHDRLDGTVDYGAVYAVAAREMGRPSQLLEHVAARLARAVLDGFPTVSRVTVRLRKDTPPVAACCGNGMGVELTAERDADRRPHAPRRTPTSTLR